MPELVAASVTDPWLRSACVRVYVASNVADWPGASVVAAPEQVPAGLASVSQVGPVVRATAGAVCASLTPTPVRVTLPVLVATNW